MPKPSRLRIVGAIGMLGCIALAFMVGRGMGASQAKASAQASDLLNYQMVMAAFDAGWRVTWQGAQPEPDRASADQQCWRVPLYDIQRDPQPLQAWRCVDSRNEPTYTWVVEKKE